MSNFNNMIQVLTYFADQCDMFAPMLQGVKDLNEKNQILDEKIRQTNILYDRMQLNATYLADNANFGVEILKTPEAEAAATALKNIEPKENISFNDRYNLIKAVISVGKDNYDREKMEQLLDFYSMLNIINSLQYEKLLNIIDEQHEEPGIIEMPDISTYPIKENKVIDEEKSFSEEEDIKKAEASENKTQNEKKKK